MQNPEPVPKMYRNFEKGRICLISSAFMFVTLLATVSGQSATYFIKSTDADHCLDYDTQLCFSLAQFAQFAINHDANTSIILLMLPGIHVLEGNLTMANILDLKITPYSNHTNVTIMCESSSCFLIESIQRALISDLNLIGCGSNIVKNVEEFFLSDTIFEGKAGSGTSLTFFNTTAKILRTNFINNQFGTLMQSANSLKVLTTNVVWFVYQNGTENMRVGGALIVSYSNISLRQCNFLNNKANVGGDIFTEETSTISIYNSTFSGGDRLMCSTGFNKSPFGGSIFSYQANILISECQIDNKHAIVGGAIASSVSNFLIEDSKFLSNCAPDHGGALFSYNSSIVIHRSCFQQNQGGGGAGVSTHQGSLYLETTVFTNNTAWRHGAALDLYQDFSTIHGCTFKNNIAKSFAGAILFWLSTSEFYGNSSQDVNVQSCNVGTYSNCYRNGSRYIPVLNETQIASGSNQFINNKAPTGAAVYIITSTIKSFGHVLFLRNNATLYASVYFLDSEGIFEGITEILHNLGSFFAFNSRITFSGCNNFAFCSPSSNTTNFTEGGALTSIFTTLTLHGISRVECNHADVGGGIVAAESKVYLNDNVMVFNNYATTSGGGMHFSQSELHSLQESNVTIFGNHAVDKGGGIHAISSSIICIVTGLKDQYGNTTELYKGALLNIVKNKAKLGGALFLEANSKVTMLKDYIFETHNYPRALNFKRNSADYGGAVYVDDESYTGTCASNPFEAKSPRSECFIRVIATHTIITANTNYSLINAQFESNTADVAGSSLFGGLLDRCSVSLFNEVDRTINMTDNEFLTYKGDALEYFMDISAGSTLQSVSSFPVQVCICILNDNYNCSYGIQNTVNVRKGEFFNLSVIAVDHVYRPVNATIQGSLGSATSDLTRGQVTPITDKCTNISFQVESFQSYEELTLFASGPCNNAELSRMKVDINFLPCSCPIGFEESNVRSSSCFCQCHSEITPYVVNCNSETQTFIRDINVWITFVNQTNSSGYIVYKYCPFDYCVPPNISAPVNLNLENGTDIQCALNRTGTLCGACKSGLSLSLGSSKCLKCPHYWPALFVLITISALIAGVGLVVLILWLNLTVAVGTLNGLLFYANIVSANRVVLLPYPEPNFITVFISWLNLELGIDVCYIAGMNTFIKTWLQLAFPIYIILLVLLLIVVSRYSSRFSKLIAKRNPVATLATLILISYGKLFNVVLLAQPFSFAKLSYPNGSQDILWLPDGTVSYFTGKHVVLFTVALLILAICVAYSLLLLCWQSVLRLPNWKVFKCFTNPNFYLFMETYHVPYVPRHRYWTGMLLFARAILYLISAANVSGNPQIQLISIICVVCFIVLYKMFIATKIYKRWLVDILESFFYINTVLFASITSYNLSTGNYKGQDAIAYTSVVLAILVTIFLILYHVYEYTTLFPNLIKGNVTKRFENFNQKYLSDSNKRQGKDPHCNINTHAQPITDDSISRFDDIMDLNDVVISDSDYHNIDSEAYYIPQRKPTQSVVEID